MTPEIDYDTIPCSESTPRCACLGALPCEHTFAYRCSDCGKCYQCKHKLKRNGDGRYFWKCFNKVTWKPADTD